MTDTQSSPLTFADGRTEADDRRVAIHEASHAVVMRFVSGQPLEGATVDPSADFAGKVWGERAHVAALDRVRVEGMTDVVSTYKPGPGESGEHLADIVYNSHRKLLGLVSGTIGEQLLLEGEPFVAHSDWKGLVARQTDLPNR